MQKKENVTFFLQYVNYFIHILLSSILNHTLMTQQEIYAWASLGSSLAVTGFYLITVFGWPEGLPDYTAELTGLFVKVFIFAFLVEFVLGILESINGPERDERDVLIASKGYRNAYLFLSAVIAVILVQLLLDDFFSGGRESLSLLSESRNTFHALFITVLAGSVVNRATQIFYYRTVF